MNTFYIARHGETLNNRAKRLSGWVDTPLTDNGLVPTEAVIKKLALRRIDAMHSSDLGRAFITAYAIAEGIGFTNEIIREPDLREVNYGVAAHLLSSKAYELYPRLDRDTHYTPEDGESLQHMQMRVLERVFALNDTYTDKAILIVAHSGVMAALNASYLGQDFGAHNISEAYPHEYVGTFTVADRAITSFAELK